MYVMKTYSVLFFLSEYIHILKVNGRYIYMHTCGFLIIQNIRPGYQITKCIKQNSDILLYYRDVYHTKGSTQVMVVRMASTVFEPRRPVAFYIFRAFYILLWRESIRSVKSRVLLWLRRIHINIILVVTIVDQN